MDTGGARRTRRFVFFAVVVIFVLTVGSCITLPHDPSEDPDLPVAHVAASDAPSGSGVEVTTLDCDWTYWSSANGTETHLSVEQVESYEFSIDEIPSVTAGTDGRVSVSFDQTPAGVTARCWSEKDIEAWNALPRRVPLIGPLVSLVQGATDLPAEEDTSVELTADGTARLRVESGYRYELVASFDEGWAEYVFTVA